MTIVTCQSNPNRSQRTPSSCQLHSSSLFTSRHAQGQCSSSQHQPASTRSRGRGSASTRGRGSTSTCGRGCEESCTLPTPSGDSGPSASLNGSAGEELPVHMDRLMAVICAEDHPVTW